MALTLQRAGGQQDRARKAAASMQLVGFRLAQEEYAVEITKVQEIVLPGEITRLPQTPDFVKGLINLRSTVIPVVDLRLRLGLPAEDPTPETRIVVVKARGKTLGMLVDGVSEVLRVSPDQIMPPPPAIAGADQEYMTGLVKLDDRLLIMLDLDQVLNEEQNAEAEVAAAV